MQTFLFYFYIMRTFFYGSIQLFVELAGWL